MQTRGQRDRCSKSLIIYGSSYGTLFQQGKNRIISVKNQSRLKSLAARSWLGTGEGPK
jgi:hypothetical protein